MSLPEPDELTRSLSEFVVNLDLAAVDEGSIESAKMLILDVVGAGLAGHDAEAVAELRDLILEIGGKEEANVLGVTQRVPAHVAAMVNGAACRALEIDDVHETAVNHISATVVPAAIAAAQSAGRTVSGEEFITAVIAGTEVAIRMSLAARPLEVWDASGARRGMSTTFQVGVFAAAVTAAKLWQIPVESMPFVLGFAYSGASGNQQGTYDGAQVIRLQQGLSTGTGVFAARLARAGLTAATRALEGEAGYFNLYWKGRHDRSIILDDLGSAFHIKDISIKPYPCCKCIHNSMTAVNVIREQGHEGVDDIESIEVVVPSREYFYTVSHPEEAKQRPTNFVEAQFSLPYAVALTFAHGLPDLPLYAAGLDDPKVMGLATRVHSVLEEGETIPAPAKVRVTFVDGTTRSHEVSLSVGHPDLPMNWSQVEEKFAGVAGFGRRPISSEAAREIAEAVSTLQHVTDVDGQMLSKLAW